MRWPWSCLIIRSGPLGVSRDRGEPYAFPSRTALSTAGAQCAPLRESVSGTGGRIISAPTGKPESEEEGTSARAGPYGRRGKTKFCRKFFAKLSYKKACGRRGEAAASRKVLCPAFFQESWSKIGVPWLSSTRPAWMWVRASAGDSFTCSPERMFFTAHRPAAISSSPRKMT